MNLQYPSDDRLFQHHNVCNQAQITWNWFQEHSGYLTIDVVTTLTQANFYDIYGGEVCLHTKITVAAL